MRRKGEREGNTLLLSAAIRVSCDFNQGDNDATAGEMGNFGGG